MLIVFPVDTIICEELCHFAEGPHAPWVALKLGGHVDFVFLYLCIVQKYRDVHTFSMLPTRPYIFGRSGLRALHKTKCPLLTAFFSLLSLSLSAWVTFFPEGVVLGF